MKISDVFTASGAQSPSSSSPQDLNDFLDAHRVDLSKYEAVRRKLHADPELSKVESSTGKYIAGFLRELGYSEIHSGVGGTGVAAVLRNGRGPTVLLRADMDGLPVVERTGLKYASTKRMRDTNGNDKPVMHACGHDTHMTCLLAAAETLIGTRAHWAGTLELVFQPAEELLAGARAMVGPGELYSLIPEPDVLLGQHVSPNRAGRIDTRAGALMAAVDVLEVTLHGRGAHASQPESSIDPVVMAAATVQRLQGIVSREVSPRDAAVVTVGAIHAGSADNVIDDSATMLVNVRSFREPVRESVLAAIRRIVRAEAQASGAEKEPTVKVLQSGPVTVNDAAIHERLVPAFRHRFGHDFNPDAESTMGSEDFGLLGSAIDKPYFFWFFGGTDPDKYDDAIKKGRPGDIPSNHSPFFAPVMQPTLKAGIDAMMTAAMTYLSKSSDAADPDEVEWVHVSPPNM